MKVISLIGWFIFGTILGSFLNVLIHRLPRGESVITPGSYCPACKKRLKFHDLLPILSFILTLGKCRYCRAPISFRYPMVEILSGLTLMLLPVRFGYSLDFLFWAIFILLLIVITFTDLEEFVIADSIILIGIIAGLIFSFIRQDIKSALLGIILGWFFMLALAKISSVFFKKEAMGEGDIKLSMLLGSYLGWSGLTLSLFLSFIIGGLIGLTLILSRIKRMDENIPFGPMIAISALISLFFGDKILAWYLKPFML